MHHPLKVIALTAALMVPVAVTAQAPDRDRRENSQQNRRYEDKAHKDYHQWDDREDQAYRRYLEDQKRSYRDFSKTGKREQNEYWNWRHSHPDNDHR